MDATVWAFWSPIPGQGTTLCAMDTAMRLKKMGRKVIVWDMNVSHASFASYWNIPSFEEDRFEHFYKFLSYPEGMTMDMLKMTMHYHGGMYFVPPLMDYGKSFSQETYAVCLLLFEKMKQMADDIVVDGGSGLWHSMAYVAVTEADFVHVVGRAFFPMVRDWLRLREGLRNEQRTTNRVRAMGLVVQDYEKGLSLRLGDVADAMGLPLWGYQMHDVRLLQAINEGNLFTWKGEGIKWKKEAPFVQRVGKEGGRGR